MTEAEFSDHEGDNNEKLRNEPDQQEKYALSFLECATSDPPSVKVGFKFYMGVQAVLERKDPNDVLKYILKTEEPCFKEFVAEKEREETASFGESLEVSSLKRKLDDVRSAKADTDKIVEFLSLITTKAHECSQIGDGGFVIFEGEVLKAIQTCQGIRTTAEEVPYLPAQQAISTSPKRVSFPSRSVPLATNDFYSRKSFDDKYSTNIYENQGTFGYENPYENEGRSLGMTNQYHEAYMQPTVRPMPSYRGRGAEFSTRMGHKSRGGFGRGYNRSIKTPSYNEYA